MPNLSVGTPRFYVQTVRVNANAIGDSTVVAATASQRIWVLSYGLTATGGGTLAIKSGSSTTLAEIVFVVSITIATAVTFAGSLDSPAFVTAAGEALVFNTAVAQGVKGHISYVLSDA